MSETSTKPRSMSGKRRGRRALVVLLALLTGLAAAECLARIAQPNPIPRVRRDGSVKMPSPNPLLRFENRPGAAVSVVVYPAEGAPKEVSVRINEAGFRGPPLRREPASASLRIACVGDSHTYGHGVLEDQAWPGQIGLGLASAMPEGDFEVINAGVSGYDAEQTAEWLSKRVLSVDPDVVLLQFHVNDARLGGLGFDDDWLLALTHPRRGDWIDALRRRSRAVDLVFDNIYRRRGTRIFVRTTNELYLPEHPAWERVATALRRMRDECARQGASFAIGLFPYLAWHPDGGELVSARGFQHLVRWCEQEGIAVLDPELSFRESGPESLRISPNDMHANARGHALFASEFLDFATGIGLFTPAETPPAQQENPGLEQAPKSG